MKKGITVNHSIIASIQPQCTDFFQKIKDEKKRQAKTNKDISDWTGIPLSNVNKFLSGNIANPNFYYTVSACIFFGISIDDAFGIKKQSKQDTEHINELETKLHDYERELEFLKRDRENLLDSLKARKMIITVLFGVCVMLIVSIGFGVIYDSILPDQGFIQQNKIATISIILIAVIVVAIAATVTIMAMFLYKNKEKR